jgi:hypothetical protein
MTQTIEAETLTVDSTTAPKRRGRPRKPRLAAPTLDQSTPVFDLDNVIAELAGQEPDREPFTFRYKGEEWKITGDAAERDIRMFGERGMDDMSSITLAFRAMLGDEQWSRFPAIGINGVLEILKAWATWKNDLTLGE